MRKVRIIIIAFLVFVIALVASSVFFYQSGLKPVTSKSEEVVFEVVSGTTYQETIDKLHKEGLIKNTFVAKVFLKFNDVKPLKANTYILDKNMGVAKLFDILGNGYFEYLITNQFTIVEGATVPKVADVLAKFLSNDSTTVTSEEVIAKMADPTFLNSLIEKYWFLTDAILNDKLLFPLEGYLFPETYILSNEEVNLDTAIYAMLDMCDTILTPYKERIEATGMSVHELISFISLVERESLYDSDKAKIAGVFMNRLDTNMLLQSDTTVLYALQETRIKVYNDDLKVDSLYNTYKYPGLPVGPVSNFGKVTLEACLDYEKSDKYYFFACNDGTVIYSKTLTEHEASIEKAKAEGKWWD